MDEKKIEHELNRKLGDIKAGMLKACQEVVKLKGEADDWRQELQKVIDQAGADMLDVKAEVEFLRNNFPFADLDNISQVVSIRWAFSEDSFMAKLAK